MITGAVCHDSDSGKLGDASAVQRPCDLCACVRSCKCQRVATVSARICEKFKYLKPN